VNELDLKRHILRNARELRKTMTEEEKKLWYRLRCGQLGVRFRRQAPRGVYVADFLCHDPKLIIELDGGQHSEQVEYDRERTIWLEGEGFTVLRSWNYQINTNLDGVLDVIRRYIDDLCESKGKNSKPLL
jgi:very-short-patch-repair endonuclease